MPRTVQKVTAIAAAIEIAVETRVQPGKVPVDTSSKAAIWCQALTPSSWMGIGTKRVLQYRRDEEAG